MFAQAQLTERPADMPLGKASLWSVLGLVLLATLGLSAPLAADQAGEFRIGDAHAWVSNNSRLLDAQFSIRLSSGAREALENGVPLTFELQAQLVRKHDWLWDSVVVEHVEVRRLEYHALSRSFLVKDMKTGRQGNYSRLVDALQAVGTIEKLVLTSKPLNNRRRYEVRLRGNLDIESLPTPVRLLAYVSSDWDMNGEWYAWPLAR
ncbi:MAG TPA: DUF4390 domain-containing protein [Gammaproteobacteria bacterium]|nr:DUF4390 domain-containing protein [Gammaproteobacteria bacterium]